MSDEHEPRHIDYSMVFPLVACDDQGGPYDSTSFVAGVRYGKWETLLRVRPHMHRSYEYPGLVPQLDLLAMHHGYTMTTEPYDDQWTLVTMELGGSEPA